MTDFKPILFLLGLLIAIFSLSAILPITVSFLQDSQEWQGFAIMLVTGIFLGGLSMISTYKSYKKLNLKQAFITTTLAWISVPLLASIPFYFSASLSMSFVDAYFEAVSGITTTGATVITQLDTTDDMLLLWRSLLQWLGGIGIIVMALALLPILQVGGMQIFKAEFSDKMEKGLPTATKMSLSIVLVYVFLTLICVVLYFLAGMQPFDALNHAMTTVSTGGFSTHDRSFGWFDNDAIELIAVLFMILGSLPFILYLQAVNSHFSAFLQDSQVKLFIISLFIMSFMAWVGLGLFENREKLEAFTSALFNVTSVMTGSGFSSEDYGKWQYFPVVFFFFLMFTGGCAGSTTCGVKIFRIQVLLKTGHIQLKRMLQPHQIHVITFNNRSIGDDVRESVMGFFILFMVVFAVLAALLSLTNMDFLSAVSGAAASLANVGPGLGDVIGPAGNYSSLDNAAKIILLSGMIIGRLEIFTALILLLPSFWRN